MAPRKSRQLRQTRVPFFDRLPNELLLAITQLLAPKDLESFRLSDHRCSQLGVDTLVARLKVLTNPKTLTFSPNIQHLRTFTAVTNSELLKTCTTLVIRPRMPDRPSAAIEKLLARCLEIEPTFSAIETVILNTVTRPQGRQLANLEVMRSHTGSNLQTSNALAVKLLTGACKGLAAHPPRMLIVSQTIMQNASSAWVKGISEALDSVVEVEVEEREQRLEFAYIGSRFKDWRAIITRAPLIKSLKIFRTGNEGIGLMTYLGRVLLSAPPSKSIGVFWPSLTVLTLCNIVLDPDELIAAAVQANPGRQIRKLTTSHLTIQFNPEIPVHRQTQPPIWEPTGCYGFVHYFTSLEELRVEVYQSHLKRWDLGLSAIRIHVDLNAAIRCRCTCSFDACPDYGCHDIGENYLQWANQHL